MVAQATSWPAEIDVFLAVGELAFYVAYLDDWPARQRIWPWTTALTGPAVSIAANIGHDVVVTHLHVFHARLPNTVTVPRLMLGKEIRRAGET